MESQAIQKLRTLNRQQAIALAQKAGVNWQVVYRICLGLTKNPRINTVMQLAPHLESIK